MNNVIAITVAYHPQAEFFLPLLDKLLGQTESVVIVDNTPKITHPELDAMIASCINPERCTLIHLGENLGIAKAINLGVGHALKTGADFVLLSDQDSLPAEDMVPQLLAAQDALVSRGVRVGAVGPTFTDLHTGLTYPFQTQLPGRFFYGHQEPTDGVPHVEALTLITSGTLIPAEVIRDVGPMREDFFIDQVDIEWCHRARSKGYALFGTGWARMYQRMGEARLRLWYLRWRYESAYSPLRIYYRLRNFVAMLKLGYIDRRWKVRNAWYWLGIVYAHVAFGEQPAGTLKMSAKGIWHGLIGKMGRYGG